MRYLGLVAASAAMLFSASTAQAARTITLTIDATGSGVRVLGYGSNGMVQTAKLEAASVSVVLNNNVDDPNYFTGGTFGSYINVYFGADNFSLFTMFPPQSYYEFNGSASVCTANSSAVGDVRPINTCNSGNTLSFNSSSPGGYGESFTGSVTRYTIQEGNTLGSNALIVSTIVPEPSTWALLFTGFMLTGYALRRRRVAFA
ncbi:hypothetical protein QE361_000007 [Sphingomonas sp. SORGH_AS802]|uniref:PEPxxWA-CTERM sorting domain-containing protein n=1 Tax=Sphingomonas sp. SORGH_AS_0802 TaxID=3041800 RepID=UPI002863B5FB|nr:PEPxxWA-CTERM sorting domain-containing protein [Sphingomonas sp. SORGH_AS_0802]MDR6133049.1 hypothetical protein [Sphingomonas sp. SORGH_AS_0802]